MTSFRFFVTKRKINRIKIQFVETAKNNFRPIESVEGLV